MRRLPDTSLTVALAAGGREFLGWGQDRHLMADLFDALNANTRASGQWAKGKAPKLPEYPRPKATTPQPEQRPAVTVAQLYAQFQGR
ncbi:hypothetical protein [Streptomyces sp. AP-93]|uniref:hypothetical protein n=1 Tax=Streptomyces sp. AP-93 TaxID=2929048 RepID=UPI001FAF6445|nr:hypothetical protein [Streptomyces sp. AP-93]MCJ0870255.1 hypothetical protein [Streptomyces sp. AP-93]